MVIKIDKHLNHLNSIKETELFKIILFIKNCIYLNSFLPAEKHAKKLFPFRYGSATIKALRVCQLYITILPMSREAKAILIL